MIDCVSFSLFFFFSMHIYLHLFTSHLYTCWSLSEQKILWSLVLVPGIVSIEVAKLSDCIKFRGVRRLVKFLRRLFQVISDVFYLQLLVDQGALAFLFSEGFPKRSLMPQSNNFWIMYAVLRRALPSAICPEASSLARVMDTSEFAQCLEKCLCIFT